MILPSVSRHCSEFLELSRQIAIHNDCDYGLTSAKRRCDKMIVLACPGPLSARTVSVLGDHSSNHQDDQVKDKSSRLLPTGLVLLLRVKSSVCHI